MEPHSSRINISTNGRSRAAGLPDRRRRTGEHNEVQRAITLVTEPAEPRPVPAISVVPRRRAEIANRVINFVLAVIALVIVAPIMLLVALAVKLTSPGPVLYTQTRVGLDRRSRRTEAIFCRRREDHGGDIFTIYKFRSMYDDAEGNTGAVWAEKNDPRVTPLGRFLRASRLDELPQLFNVIQGDMNIVGPRPERPSIFAKLREDVPEYQMRQRARPGITGWAQVNHTYDTSVADVRVKVRYDLEYLERQSIVEDFRIMLRTVPVMLFRRGGW
jgi:lipopolysaccharide/colanic/teichoic acid biosynthesis glycosyltransferase